jgi:hypothetical protein
MLVFVCGCRSRLDVKLTHSLSQHDTTSVIHRTKACRLKRALFIMAKILWAGARSGIRASDLKLYELIG